MIVGSCYDQRRKNRDIKDLVLGSSVELHNVDFDSLHFLCSVLYVGSFHANTIWICLQMTKDEVLASVLDALESHIEDPRQDRLINNLIKDIKRVTAHDSYFYLAEGRDGITRFFRDTSHIPAGFFILGKIKLEHL